VLLAAHPHMKAVLAAWNPGSHPSPPARYGSSWRVMGRSLLVTSKILFIQDRPALHVVGLRRIILRSWRC